MGWESKPARTLGASLGRRNTGIGSRAAAIAVVESTDHRLSNDLASVRRLDFTSKRRIAFQGHVATCLVVVSEEGRQDSTQMSLVQYDDVGQALAANAADEPLDEAVCFPLVRNLKSRQRHSELR